MKRAIDPAASNELAEIAAQKASLRQQLVSRIRALPPESRALSAQRASSHLTAFLESALPAGATVALFAATKTELSCDPAIERLRQRFTLAFPRVGEPLLTFHRADFEQLTAHQTFVREPLASAPMAVPDAVVLPGRAFDQFGVRLGHGAGWYDRTLPTLPESTLLVGYVFDFQVVDELPRTSWDRWAQWLVTDERPAWRCKTRPDSVRMPPEDRKAP